MSDAQPASPEPGRTSGPSVPSRASAPKGRLASGVVPDDYRDHLVSRRWNAAPLRNPEVEKSDPRIVVAAIAILSAITLIVIVAGYASGFWG